MDPVRIGCVKYLNTLPLIEGLRTWRDCELVAAVPSRLIDMLIGDEVDVALASVIDAARQSATLLPVGMIGCDGPTLTVRLFSRVPIEAIATVGADTDSHTSVVLMQVLLWKMHGRRVRVLDFDAREHMVVGLPPPSLLRSDTSPAGAGEGAEPDALLLIGDKVVTDAPDAAIYPHQLDLGTAWKDLTGLPFVYAVWMCRAGEEDSLTMQAAAKMLERTRRHNQTRLGWIVASRAEERHWPEDLAAKYLGSYLKYDIGEPEREAVEKFLRWAAELGLCAASEARWAGNEMAKSK
ncbi:MAG TPA: menaquinone biosynthesis protein [Phycisphaerales bacterium]|nr:menaquinone biosynthesis protein [Phycisphaerales bacterium]